jgi:hypothetical protein
MGGRGPEVGLSCGGIAWACGWVVVDGWRERDRESSVEERERDGMLASSVGKLVVDILLMLVMM